MNLLNYIKPKQDPTGLRNSLDGLGVTPFNQNFNNSEERGFNLLQILNDESLLAKFQRFTFPKVETMSDGCMFINPRKHVITPTENQYIKWLIFNTDFSPVHDHNYPMTRLPKNGYMMKITIPILSENPDEFQIEYIIDYHNIQVDVSNSINNISQIQNSDDRQITVQVNAQNELNIKEYMLGVYPEIDSLISDKKLFFETYASDALEAR